MNEHFEESGLHFEQTPTDAPAGNEPFREPNEPDIDITDAGYESDLYGPGDCHDQVNSGLVGTDPERQTDPADPALQPPPVQPPVEHTGEANPPERGGALYRLLDFARRVPHDIQQALIEKIEEHPTALALLKVMTEAGTPLEQAISTILNGNVLGDKTHKASVDEAYSYSTLQYETDMKSVGLTLIPDSLARTVFLVLTDPDAYTAALQDLPIPETNETQNHIARQNTDIVTEALLQTANSIALANPAALQEVYGDSTLPDAAASDILPIEAAGNFTEAFARQADTLAGELERRGVAATTTAPLRSLALAARGNIITEWALAHQLGLTRPASGPPPASILNIGDGSPAYAYLTRLQRMAPDTLLTQQIRSATLQRIQNGITMTRNALDAAPAEGESLTPEQYDYMETWAKQLLAKLRIAQRQVERIMPPRST